MTEEGKLKVEEADLQYLNVEGPPPARPPAKPASPAKKEPAFKGLEVRSPVDPNQAFWLYPEPALFVGGTRRIALLDYASEELVVVDLPEGAVTRVKVEAGPSCLIEKSGRIYVANRKAGSLTVVDASSLKVVGRIAVESPPRWLAAPAREDVVYVKAEEGHAPIKILDTRAGRLAGPVIDKADGRPLDDDGLCLSVSPDHRMLITLGRQGGATPFFLAGTRATRCLGPVEGSPGPLIFDFPAVRAYGGEFVYTLDLSRRLATLPTTRLAPHPSRSLVFGAERGRGQVRSHVFDSSGRVLVYDEETLAPVCAIELGDEILAFLPAEDILYVLAAKKIYPVELAGNVPAEALAKRKIVRAPVDLLKPPSDADAKKAQHLASQALAALDAGQAEDAKAKAEAAWAVDPLSNAKLVLVALAARSLDPLPALDEARLLRGYPFRDLSGTVRAVDYLGTSLAACGRVDEAVQTYYEGLVLDPEDARLLKGLGVQAKAQGNEAVAYAAWSRSLAADAKQAELRKSLDALTGRLVASTSGPCAACGGAGKHETIVEEPGKPRRKTTQACRTCAGRGKTWKRPCAACLAGTWRKRAACEACLGSSHRPEPLTRN